ncbi:MAG: nucleoside phosphorylase [Actinobacteria bacterium]|jgi:uridine phosphorylase|nr:nucleoside phosphorylase [Actinomycetota bacterium]MBT7013917.1 nucleoside phosphorylase [Actinomycetota bacterium]|tara:strand:+ start:378 stop:1121 length:744 start_codon:yes stop_codon:yes gene_type:complete
MFNNKIEQVKHLPLKIGEVARYVIVPGDPNRVEIIASVMDSYTLQGRNREFNAARGTYKGTDVSVVSTGIGCPSTAIAVEELAHVGAEVFIRIGTSGSVDNSVEKGDIFIATGAVRDDGTSKQYIPIEFPAVADFKLVANLIKASKDLNIDTKVGICQSKDSFFGEVEPERMPVAPYLDYKWKAWQKGGVGASEMEAATLFTLAQIKKLKASAVLAVEVSDEETVKKMTQIVLECIHIMEMERLNEK